jgi:hypothetical protein
MATVSNVTRDDIVRALEAINASTYAGNIKFKRGPESLNQKGTRHAFTLTVQDSRGEGSRISASAFSPERRVAAACWHAHGHFYDALLELAPNAIVRTAGSVISADGGNWQDWQAGSMAYPRMMSELCDCETFYSGITGREYVPQRAA